MKYYDEELLYASDENTGYFFTETLTPKISEKIRTECSKHGFTNYFIHGFTSHIDDEHFLKLDRRLF